MAISEAGRIKIKTDGIYQHNDTTNQYGLLIKMGTDYVSNGTPASGTNSVFVADSYSGIGNFNRIDGAHTISGTPSPDNPATIHFLGDEGSLNFKSSQCKLATSILDNGSFETGLNGWIYDEDQSQYFKISSDAKCGERSADISANADAINILAHSFKTIKNHKYKLCGFAKVIVASSNDEAGISIGLSDYGVKVDITKLNVWQRLETPVYIADSDDYEMGVFAIVSADKNSVSGIEVLFDGLSLVDLTAENAVDAVINETDGKCYEVTTTNQTKSIPLSEPLRALPNGTKDYFAEKSIKNLFNKVTPFSETSPMGSQYTCTYDTANDLIVTQGRSGYYYAKTQKIKVKPNAPYTVSGHAVGVSHRILFFKDNTQDPHIGLYDVNADSDFNYTFNNIDTEYLYLEIMYDAVPSGLYGIKNLQIEQGSTATAYEPYFTSPSYVYRCGYIRISSNYSIYAFASGANADLMDFYIYGMSNVKINSSILCTHFPDGSNLGAYTNRTVENISGFGDKSANFVGAIAKSRLTSPDLAGVKAWFDANNVYIAYEFETPTVTAADDMTFTSFDGATLVSFENEVKPSELEISYPNTLVKGMNDYINDNSRNMSARVNMLLNDSSTLVLSGSDLMQSGLKVSGGVTASGKFEIGDAVSTKLSLILNNFKDGNSAGKFDKTDFSGSIIKPFTDITIPADLNATPQRTTGTTISIPLGVFYLDEYNSQGNTINLSAYDGLFLFDIPYSKITSTVYPATFSKIVTDICNYIGVQLENTWFPHWSTLVEKKPDTKDLTCRQMLSYVAQLAGCFVKCNRYGDIRFEWFMPQTKPINDGTINGNTDLNVTDTLNGNTGLSVTDVVNGNVQIVNRLDPTDYGYFDIPFISDYSSDSAGGSQITGVEYVPENSDDAITRTGTDAYVLSIENNPLIQDNVDIFVKSLADEIVGFTVRNINIKTLDNPLLDTGANARFTDKLGNTIIFPITSLSYQFGEYSQLGSDCESQASNGSTLSYDSNSKIQRYMSQISQNGISKYEKMIMDTNTFLASAAGFYETKIYDDKTGEVVEYYQHNLPNLADSTMILKVTVDGIFESKDKGKTYTSLVESDGRSNITQLASRIIVANLIRTGKLQSMNGLSEFDLDTGLFDYGNGTFKLEKNSDIELDNDYMLTTRGLVRAISEVKDRESEKAKTVTATLGTRLEVSQNDFVKSTATVNDLDSQGNLLTSTTHIVSDYISIQSVPDYPLEVRYKFKCDEAFIIDGIYLFDVNKNCLAVYTDNLKLRLPQEVYYLRFKIRKYDSSIIALSDLNTANVVCGPLNTQVGELRFEGTDVDGNTLQLGQLMGYGIPNSGYSGFELHGDLGVQITGGLTTDADIYVNKTGDSSGDRLVFNQGNLQSGSVNITPSAANTPTNVTITFPNPFNTAPIVVATPVTGGPGTYVKGVAVLGVTTTQCTIVLTRADVQTTAVNWIAVGT